MPPADRPLNILRVITWLPVGGIERRLVAVLPRLDRARFNVRLVCLRERGALADELEAAGIPVDLVPFRKRWDPVALAALARLMRRHQIDLVHSHMYRANVPAAVAARLAGVRRVWAQVHNVGTWETPRQAWMDRALCRWRTGVIAVSERVRADVMRTLRLPEARVPVIYNGVDLARFAGARPRREAVRAAHGAGPGQVVFLFAARLVEQKRATDFLTAFGNLQKALGQIGDAGCDAPSEPAAAAPVAAWVLGDGPLRGALEAQAAALPCPRGVRFFGKRDDVEDFMAAADVLVLPSDKEGFSNALIEALATGLPAVASDVGGNGEAVRDGREGFIIAPRAPEALGAAMLRLAREPELRHAMSEAASARAQAFSLEAMIARVEALYSEG